MDVHRRTSKNKFTFSMLQCDKRVLEIVSFNTIPILLQVECSPSGPKEAAYLYRSTVGST
jgi:hypothetical protein